jgi:DNA primase
MISDEIIEKIKYENDIVDVISESVRLKRAGRNYLGLCPFHHEKTPSFSVSPEKQIYKCFGCGEAGNVITFVMKLKNKSFPEACEYLAEKASIEMKTDNRYDNQKAKYNKMYEINVEAARFFFNNLKNNNVAKEYFFNRGINQKTINKFGLGYSLNNWNGVLNYLKSKGYTELDMLSLGLISKSPKGRYYDLFKNRVMFPVFNVRGKVIGFGGRVFGDTKPKYLNSPETILFKKGTNLYGLNLAIKDLSEKKIIIVEGYMDCISLHQYGITNTVASLGTALTGKQAKLLKRYTDEVIISYDADAAGQAATLRGLEILKNEGFLIKVLTVPKGKDPDEFIKINGKEAFLELIKNALPLIEYKIEKCGEGVNFEDREQMIKYVGRVAQVIVNLDPIEKDVYIKKISEKTNVNEQAIYDVII